MSEQSISFGNPYLSTGSSSVTHIANVPDNDMTDITRLLELWRNKYPRNLLRSAFYDAKQRFNNLGISIPNIVAQKAGVVVGWPQKACARSPTRACSRDSRPPPEPTTTASTRSCA